MVVRGGPKHHQFRARAAYRPVTIFHAPHSPGQRTVARAGWWWWRTRRVTTEMWGWGRAAGPGVKGNKYTALSVLSARVGLLQYLGILDQ